MTITEDGEEITVTVTNTFVEVLGTITEPVEDGPGTSTGTPGGGLALTGLELLILILLALSLLLAGSALFLITRERPEDGTT